MYGGTNEDLFEKISEQHKECERLCNVMNDIMNPTQGICVG